MTKAKRDATPRRTRETLDLLRRYESRNTTFISSDGTWPIVWARARGTQVWDVDGRGYLDLTSAFGVANAGHANPRIVRAGQRQMGILLHAMGDVHPHPLKGQLARELSRLTFERWGQRPMGGKTIFCNSGFEAVEAALKTALLATGRAGIVAFEGGYHGLGYGTLNATHRGEFRGPFLSQIRSFGHFAPFPENQKALPGALQRVRELFRRYPIGAVLVEPIQGRGGIRIPPREFLPSLRALCDQHKALLLVDEIFTGFGRTGRWFGCEHSGVTPDLISVGKALTGGFPLSACVGRSDLMDVAWPVSRGEAIHTSTFLGHPVGCAMALENLKELQRHGFVERSAKLGEVLLEELEAIEIPGLVCRARGAGLMAGVELTHPDGSAATAISLEIVRRLLRQGYIVLPEGEQANVIAFTPPLTIARKALSDAIRALQSACAAGFSSKIVA